ncbi:hypothetical protein Tco_0941585 [Tanacetum coccineum]|uniref:Uncharacterized protein n=1 Tax=Tanacetum coccineum TaxID=301880 RepID=A0ABQ5DRB6_9ASTR
MIMKSQYAFVSIIRAKDFSTEPTLCPQHIDEFDLKGETSLSEYDEVEQNVFYFNDLFPFNIIYPADLKLDKDNDDNEIDMIQSSRGNENTQGSNKLLEASHDKINKNLYVSFGIPFDPKRYYKDGDCTRMLRRPRYGTLAPHDQRHLWLCYQVEGYTEEIVYDFEQRLETIFGRQVNRVHTLDFEGLTPDMRQDLAKRLRMVYTGDDGQEDRFAYVEEMEEDGFEAYWLGSERVIPDKGDLSDYWVEISSSREFLRGAPSYTYIRDPVRRLCHRMISYNIFRRGQEPKKATVTDLFYLRRIDRRAANVPYLLAQYLFRHAEGRKSGARLFGGYYIRRLAHHFGLVNDDGLRGLSVVTRELPLIDIGTERQPVAVAAALRGAEDAPDVDEGAQAILAPMHTPPPPPPAAGRNMPQRLGRLEEEKQGIRQDVRSLWGLVKRSMTDQGRFSTWMVSCMTQLMEASEGTYEAFDGTFRGSYLVVFQRRTRLAPL